MIAILIQKIQILQTAKEKKSTQNNITSSSSIFTSRGHNINSNTLLAQESLLIVPANSLGSAACNNNEELNSIIIDTSSINIASFIEVKIRPEEGDTAPTLSYKPVLDVVSS